MCGIAGVFSKYKDVEIGSLKKMTDILRHRGPDGEGQWTNNAKEIGLGHRRLSIIDLSDKAKQPMHSIDGRYSVILNGEIYNYIELKEDLEKKGYKFFSNSDTEVLLNLYIELKAKCLDEIDGMFAFAIWDEKEKTLFCARDRFGEKPFYYYYEPGKKFVFASEMKAIFEYGIEKEINRQMVFRFLNCNIHMSNPEKPYLTFFNNILKLEPSNYLLIDKNIKLTKTKYWKLDYETVNSNIKFDDASDILKELLTTSIKRRLRSDVPVGTSLSGGLDSSTIVGLINKINSENKIVQKTFSARFQNFKNDEGYFMNQVIESVNVIPHFTWPDEDKLIDDIDKLFYHQEEPFASTSIFAEWETMKLVSQNNVKVMLDGQGADEIFAGYDGEYYLYLLELFRKDKTEFSLELDFYNKKFNKNLSSNDFVKPKKSSSQKVVESLKKAYRNTNVSRFISKNFKDHNHFTSEYWVALNRNSLEIDTLNKSLHLSATYQGLEDLLRFADRNSMAFSIEDRLPFLYHKIAEFIFSLPANFKINRGWSKFILRKSFDGLLPQEITWRKDKIGYEAPQNFWMQSKKLIDMVGEAKLILENESILKRNSKPFNSKDWECLIVSKLYE